jgi:hypothetical protein
VVEIKEERVKDKEEFVGRIRAVFRFPQYLITAMFTGAVTETGAYGVIGDFENVFLRSSSNLCRQQWQEHIASSLPNSISLGSFVFLDTYMILE